MLGKRIMTVRDFFHPTAAIFPYLDDSRRGTLARTRGTEREEAVGPSNTGRKVAKLRRKFKAFRRAVYDIYS